MHSEDITGLYWELEDVLKYWRSGDGAVHINMKGKSGKAIRVRLRKLVDDLIENHTSSLYSTETSDRQGRKRYEAARISRAKKRIKRK